MIKVTCQVIMQVNGCITSQNVVLINCVHVTLIYMCDKIIVLNWTRGHKYLLKSH